MKKSRIFVLISLTIGGLVGCKDINDKDLNIDSFLNEENRIYSSEIYHDLMSPNSYKTIHGPFFTVKYYDKNKDVLNYLKNMEMTDFGIIDFTNNDEEEKTIKVNGEDYFYSSITTYSSNILYSGDFKFYISNSDNTVFLEKSKIANDYKFRAYAISAEDKETLLNLTKTKMVSDDGFYRVDGNPSDSKYTYYGDQNYIIGKRVIDWQNNNHDLVEGNNYFKGEFPDLVFKYNKNSGNVDVYKENEKLLTSNSIYIADVNQDEHFDLCVGYSIESKDGVNYGVYFYDILTIKRFTPMTKAAMQITLLI